MHYMEESHFSGKAKEGRHRQTILYAFVNKVLKQAKHLKF